MSSVCVPRRVRLGAGAMVLATRTKGQDVLRTSKGGRGAPRGIIAFGSRVVEACPCGRSNSFVQDGRMGIMMYTTICQSDGRSDVNNLSYERKGEH